MAEAEATANGLVERLSGQWAVLTGRPYGPVLVELEDWKGPPPLDLTDWEDIVEVGLTTLSGDVRLGGLLSGVPPRMPNLVSGGPGAYRMRVSVRGRDAAAAGRGKEVHRLQLWPGPGPVEIRHQLADGIGASMRGEVEVPTLLDWEQPASGAMAELVAVLGTGPASAVGTVTAGIDIAATRSKVFRMMCDLAPVLGNGGGSPDWLGQYGYVYLLPTTPARQGLQMWHRLETTDRPSSRSWSTRWAWQDSIPEPEPRDARQPGDATLTIELDWARPLTSVTCTHAGLPLEQLPALTALWKYWLHRMKARCESGDYRPPTWFAPQP
ncbi:MAG: hypothetical protein QOE76_882 [Frankiales bacterium]|nr:hypothetical protein [Frankiales bacterium]